VPVAVNAAPPGPKGGYLFGSAAAFRRDQLGFYESCAREYGDVVQTRMGPYRILLIYHPDAIEELFVTRSRDFVKSSYFPFGGGPRQCIGNTFAQMEAVLLLATIALRFRLSLVPGQRITPTPYITLRPEPGIRMLLARR
jgi:cytochrome P450